MLHDVWSRFIIQKSKRIRGLPCSRRLPLHYHRDSVHRGAFYQFPFRWIYYYGSNKSTGKETGKTHLCALYYSSLCEIAFELRYHLLKKSFAKTSPFSSCQHIKIDPNFKIVLLSYWLTFKFESIFCVLTS